MQQVRVLGGWRGRRRVGLRSDGSKGSIQLCALGHRSAASLKALVQTDLFGDDVHMIGAIRGASDVRGPLLKMGSTAEHSEEMELRAFAGAGHATVLPMYTSANP